MAARIGIDVGGVIIRSAEKDSDQAAFIKAAEAGEDTSSMFKDNFREIPPVEGAFETIAELVTKFSAENIFIISKCGKIIQEKTIKWMLHHDFFNKTGMHAHNVHFCLAREDKAPIAKGLQLTHFIDDRQDVLSYMDKIVDWRILFMPTEETYQRVKKLEEANNGLLAFECVADSWQEVLTIVQQSS